MHRLTVLAVILISSPADAEPPFTVGLDYTVARGGAFETWDLGWRLEAGLGVHIGSWHATASAAAHMNLEPSDHMRDGDRLGGVGVGGRLAYHVRVDGHGTLFAALGFERLWFSGTSEVTRTCRQTGTCLAGYYAEVPKYDAWAPQLRLGIGPVLDPPTMRFAGTFELIIEPIAVRDVPPDGISGVAVYGAFTFSFGFGPKAKR
jgi:hypothetical protein